MDAHTVVEAWDSRPFADGYEELATLQSEGFTGAVEADSTWLFLRGGDPLAVVADIDVDSREGDVERFEGASGTIYEAPNATAVTLVAMLALDGEVRGQYYTGDTPLSKVHGTLADGNFTGYVELSENVLSGDYYVVYEDGSASYIAYLGPSSRTIHDEEAEAKAKEEIGIYDVVAVELPDVSIPSPAETDESPTAADAETDSSADSDTSSETDEEEADADGSESTSESDRTTSEETETEPTTAADETQESTTTDSTKEGTSVSSSGEGSASSSGGASDSSVGSAGASSNEKATESVGEDDRTSQNQPSRAVPQTDDVGNRSPSSGGTAASKTSTGIDDMTARRVPSLDPAKSRTETPDRSTAVQGQRETASQAPTGPMDEADDRAGGDAGQSRPEPEETDSPDIDAVRSEYERELESIRSELEAIREERDNLQDRIQRIEASDSDSGSTDAAAAGRSISEVEAIGGTSLFVRETSRGDVTLEDAHAGEGTRETVNENLRIEHHTEFDDGGATVEGEPFDAFLQDSLYYQFAHWLVTELLFEIRSTGSQRKMGSVYDALPKIDRIGFREDVTDGEEYEGTFDVVARDRMGDPLVVATIDRSRDPTREGAMGPLVEDANEIAEAHDSLAAAFAVTASYFKPEALDVAREATSGSLLSRDKRLSYVKLSRKTGYHLCMVEAREGSFHLTVPEL